MAESGLVPFADGIWLSHGPSHFLGMKLTATMTVIRLADGSLLLHSPVTLTPSLRAAVEGLGQVTHLYSPNTFHHLRLGDWKAAFPKAQLHGPPGLVPKRPDLQLDRLHGAAPPPAFAGVIEELPIHGFRLEETVLFHAPSRTLIVADLVHNIGRPAHAWTRVYTRAMGFYDTVAISRMIRWTAFPDRAALRRSLEALFARPFDKLVVGHGAPITHEAKRALVDAYRWVRPAP